MALDASHLDDVSPEDFVRRVRELQLERDREDRERAADLEKDILQSREQRRVRRADHARSLSSASPGREPRFRSPTPSTEPTMPSTLDSPTSLARSGTLSWQQRRRPLSQIVGDNRPSPKQSLDSSPAESPHRTAPPWSLKAPPSKNTPGGEMDAPPALRQEAALESPSKAAPSRFSRDLPSPVHIDTGPTGSPKSSPPLASPVRGGEVRSSQPLAPGTETGHGRALPDAPKLGPKPEMPGSGRSSPTKGMGGFVQSAMMKRSDSVNKRWSANLTGISRQNSIASNRSSYAVRMPLSSGEESSLGGQNVTDDKDLRAKNAPSLHVRSKSSIVQLGDRRPEFSSPPSPKKWSPTKSSWLESKITKSDEKPPAPPPAQPSWMADLAKAKQNRNDVSVGGPSPEFKSPQTPVRPELAPKPAPLLAQEPGVAVRKSPPPIAPKAQPSAPGKVDFRANLKPRSLQSDGGRAAEPEFKSALGKLRHTQAEKYVAPNDFKDNILRGKSALNVTGGPAKRERVDDFKQSILQQKEAMKAKSAAPKSPPEKPKEPVSTPEGLAKRNALNKRGPPVPAAKSDLVPEALARQADVRKPTLENARPSAEVRKSPAAEPPTIGAERKTAPVGTEQVVRKTDAVAPLALSTERKPTPKPLSSTTEQLAPKADVDSPTPSAALTVGKEPSAGPKYGSAKLAGRLNPGLANLLAKGPPASVSLRREEPAKADDGEGPQLRHMTKNRARGPKRRAPKAAQAAETQPSDGPRTGSEIPAPSVARPLPSAAEDMPKGKSKPPVAEKSAVLSSMVGEPEKTAQATDPTGDASREKTTQQHPFRSAVAAPSSPPRPSKPLSISAKSSRSNAASPTPSPGRPKSPIKLPAREDEVKMNFAPPKLDVDSGKPSFAIKTPGLATVESKAAPSPMPKAAPVAEPERPKKPARMTAIAIKVPPPEPSSPEPRSLFADYFDDHPRITPGCEIDVLGVLQSHPKNEKVETIRTSIHEMSGDGKLSPLPSNQEHVLFEDAMYVCVHLCKTARGTRSTEVYLWVGSSVPQAASEDGHVFARKVAKDHGGKLQLVPQGKEPSGMFAALGGILITLRQRDAETRGLPSRFMLCGRHHLGHMAFDSLDFGPGSLCSGFPYLVRGGSSLFLWAGAGCTVEELDCARLVAMDLLAASADPGAAFLEIKDGDEPPAFLDLFDRGVGRTRPPRIPPSASHWRLKPAVGSRYCSRLFRISQRSTSPRKAGALQVGHQLLGWASHLLPSPTAGSMDPAVASGSKPTSPVKEAGADLQAAACDVEELVPFDCADLQRDGGVWVLDAFFEMYIMLPPNPRAHAPAFAAALLFAQAYGILAASEDDRPFVPVTTVVLDGAPRDLRAAFRRWTGAGGEHAGKAGGLSRKGSLRVVALATALAAVQR